MQLPAGQIAAELERLFCQLTSHTLSSLSSCWNSSSSAT